MTTNTFLVFRNGKLVTVLTTIMDNYNDAVECDRYVKNPKNAEKQVEEWLKPKTRVSKIDTLKEIIRAWGMNPEEILTKNALTQPHRTVIDRSQIEKSQIHQLSIALKQQLLNELGENPNEKIV